MCPAGSTSLVQELWSGSYSACDCRGVWSASLWKREVQIDDRCYDDDEDWCMYTPPMSQMEESVVDMKKLCGVQAIDNSEKSDNNIRYLSFITAKRPEIDGKCAQGYLPCSNHTSAENTICYDSSSSSSSDANKENCPITAIQFFPSTTNLTNSEYTKSGSLWTRFDFSQQMVGYSRGFVGFYSKDTDNLPLTSFKLSSAPCMKPS